MKSTRPMRVFAADVYLTVTIEDESAGDGHDVGLHLHAGGQGVWIARMVRALGEDVYVHAALGGETGLVVEHLLRSSGIGIRPVPQQGATQGYVHDRRCGARTEVARATPGPLGRHEIDDLYEDVLAAAADSEIMFITGREHPRALPSSFYERLGADLASLGTTVVGDLHGPELDACLAAGGLALLKVSDEDVAADGGPSDEPALRRWAEEMHGRGAERVVISRSDSPTLALWGGRWLRASAPHLTVVDHRGAGDTMTGALGVAIARGLQPEAALALACGAGAASVTRHGLATVDARLVSEIAARVIIEAES